MARYQLIVEYDGSPFSGWQRQKNALSVQEVLENAIRKLYGKHVNAFSAGRTDAGVHALGMSVHIDLPERYTASVICNALNFHLKPVPVAVLSVQRREPDFHARFSCITRTYTYCIENRPIAPSFGKNTAWHISRRLDEQAMQDSARILTGRHDFTTFRASTCQSASPVRTIDTISIERKENTVKIHCTARSFLQHQVRSITGTLVQIGLGKWNAEKLKKALDARNRRFCGMVAPPHGLFFIRAGYPGDERS